MDSPLQNLLQLYCSQYKSLRESNEDLDNLNFHRHFGLSIGVPSTWHLVPALCSLAMEENERGDVVIIYPSTTMYHEFYSELLHKHGSTSEFTFFSWQELYVSMDRAGKDSRELYRFRNMLQTAVLTLLVGAPLGIPEIENQVMGFCEGCLIVVR